MGCWGLCCKAACQSSVSGILVLAFWLGPSEIGLMQVPVVTVSVSSLFLVESTKLIGSKLLTL